MTTDYDCSIKVAKSTLLQQLDCGGDFGVIGVCETWLNSTIVDGEIPATPRDRYDLSGGGVLAVVKANI